MKSIHMMDQDNHKEMIMNVRSWQITMVLLSSTLFLIGCHPFVVSSDGFVQIQLKTKATGAKVMKVQVCGDNIFRVIASPQESFSGRPSLIVSGISSAGASFRVDEKWGDKVEISTAKMKAIVSLKTGGIAFYDAKGKILLQEKAVNGKIITPAEVMGEKTYHIQQLFDSPKDEAFYGLGQHQNGIMNYKGHDVDLRQYNFVDVVPFLISSRNYGILWDNNSYTKFGDIRYYQPLSCLVLYNKDGQKGGLTAEYFSDSEFKTSLLSRTESVIAHESQQATQDFPAGFDSKGKGSIRWSGQIEADQTGTYKFRLYCSSYTKMWVNDKLVVDSWRQNWAPWYHPVLIPMQAGKRCSVKIEWIPDGGYIGLTCLTPEDPIYKDSLSLYSEVADQIDYYFIAGENVDQIVSGYRTLTGKAPMMPKWALGLWQCRERYKTQDELLGVVKEFRKRQIPLDNIVLDWRYWPDDQWGDHVFDSTRFPDPEGMVKELHNDLNTQIMISVWPKFYVGTENYKQFLDKGWLYMRNVEKGQKDWVGPGYVSTFYDAYSEGARKLYWQQIDKKLFSKGFDAWWLDATEPDIESNVSWDEYLLRIGPTALGTAARYLNTYSLMTCKGVYEGQRQSDPDKRVFILTRSAYAGQQRYSAATWSGDVACRWFDLKTQISAGINFCMSGIPYWTTDIGGFALEGRYEKAQGADLDEWREQMTRWFQFGTFCPLFRVHGQFPYREMFYVSPEDHPAYQSMLAYDKLRYRLMPYIYSLAGMVTQKDYTIMRGLAMDFGYDSKVRNIGDQFMFGPALLINPVTEYKARSRQVYLPVGTSWYELKSGRYYKGGQTITADAPYTEIPIYVKAGSIIPFGPEIQYSDQKPADPIRLMVYKGGDGSFTLYEDENVNNNYEKGAFSVIPIQYNQKTQNLVFGARQGQFPGMLKTRTFEIVWIDSKTPVVLDLNKSADISLTYDGRELTVNNKMVYPAK
jgi:alpha-D-xyloside xylohydrolase